MGKKSEIAKNIKRRGRNKAVKAGIKECAREIRKSAQRQDSARAEEKLAELMPKLDRAARKGVLHPKTAARKKSRAAIQVGKLQKTTQAG